MPSSLTHFSCNAGFRPNLGLTMIATLFAVVLLAQAAGGIVSGIVRDAAGNPVTGIRVALMTEPNVLANIGKTEASGYYRLENIPPGRYYVVAGRVDTPTYY